MKKSECLIWMSLPLLLITLSAEAHDPKEHKKNAEAPNCAFMHEMDIAKMDMKDPVMQAMMKKCLAAAKAPSCEAMKHMDPAKMDMKDPATKSTMKQCMQEMQDRHNEDEPKQSSHGHDNSKDGHQHNH